MEFSNNQPIYRQIINYCYDNILDGSWPPGEKIPSVRELALKLTVNTHTVIKALDVLGDEAIISPKRGMGFFLADDAQSRVLQAQKREFFDSTLSDAFARMRRLGISFDEVVEFYHKKCSDSIQPNR